jgi:AmmeMemoRadiSam system protein A
MDQQPQHPQEGDRLGPQERASALALAREAVELFVREGRRLDPPAGTPLSSRRCSAFVTLTLQGDLRGCIGVLEPIGSLDQTLVHCAVAAASEDRRFAPVSPGEVAGIRIEISLLSPSRPIGSAEELEVGRDGILLQARGRQGLLLPQVPVEQGWDRETFLKQACRKAGLPQEAWKWPDARLWIFTAEVFGEEPENGQGA